VGFVVGLLAGAGIASADISIQDEIRTYVSLSNETVYMTGKSELHLTSQTTPLSNCVIHLNSPEAWLFLTDIPPLTVNTSTYLSQIRVNGANAALNTNVRVVQFVQGTVVIPHSTGYQPLQVFSGVNFTGTSRTMPLYTYHRESQLAAFHDAISSFKLKRGYMATFANNSDGTGSSRVYVADSRDLNIGVMPADMDNAVSFVRVFPWRWPSKKGMAGWGNDAPTLKTTWRYDWDNAANSTLNIEYIPMRHNAGWNSYSNINNKQNTTHALGFNEPDKSDQANMTVQAAIDQWPNLLASGLRLGSPAPSDGGLSWLYSFIDAADALNYRVDFVAVHWYQNDRTAQQMVDWMNNVYRRTGRTLWITEWNNGCNWTTPHPTYEYNATKIGQLISRMDTTPFIERYSIYQGCTNREMLVSGNLTPAGIVYRDNVSTLANTLDTNFECIGFYRLDETTGSAAEDLSGRQSNAALKNGLSFAANSVPGMLGRALRFDGVDDYIELPAGKFNEFDNGFSASFWAYPTAAGSYARFVDIGNGSANNNILVTRYGTTNDLAVQVFNGTSAGSTVRATNAIALNTWQFFTVTVNPRTSSNVRIYKNGQLIQTGTTAIPQSVLRNLNYIGRSNWSTDAYYKGDLDDVRIFDYALSQSEITALYLSNMSRPFNGEPAVVPGRIEAEQFDIGGSGVAYYDTTNGNSGGQYRLDADVDIRAVADYGSGYAVTDIVAGEWMNYTVNITETADYCLSLRASATADNIPVTIKLNGSAIAAVLVNSTGSLNTFQTVVVNDLALSAADYQQLRLEFPTGGLEVNWIQIEKQGPWGGVVRTIPGKIQAEEFDIGGPGAAYYDTTVGNSGGQFRTHENVDIAAITDGNAGFAIDNIETGEWLLYTVNCVAGQTDLYARVASEQAGGQIRVLLDGELLAAINVPNTGSLSTWHSIAAHGLTLPERQNATLKLEFVGTGFRLNLISFENRAPYLGYPAAIPGRIEFENYDIGGQYISYYDKSDKNGYGYYRPTEAVDIMPITDGVQGFSTFTESPEWLEYTCSIEPGYYTIVVRSSSPYTPQGLSLSMGIQTLATFDLPMSGGFFNWRNTAVSNVYLPGGQDVQLRFHMTASSGLLNYVDFIKQPNPADITQSGMIDMNDFSILAAQWMGTPGLPSADIAPLGGDGSIDMSDILMLAENWLMAD
jgi:hypothetical protein